MKKILVTHNDLDGAGCAILFKKEYPDTEIQYHDYKTITEISKKLLKEQDKYEKIFFADISPEEEEGKQMLGNDKFIIIDHHKTREYLKGTKYFDTDWCGTVLSYRYLYPNAPLNFVMAVDAWDSWKLDSVFRRAGEDLNLLFGYYGMEKFVEEFKDMREINEGEESIVVALEKMKKDYLKHKIKQAKMKTDENGNKYWQIYIGESQSGLGNILEMVDDLPDIKYLRCVNLNDSIVSLYTLDKLDFDVSELAKKYGGGGHKKAAGYTIKE